MNKSILRSSVFVLYAIIFLGVIGCKKENIETPVSAEGEQNLMSVKIPEIGIDYSYNFLRQEVNNLIINIPEKLELQNKSSVYNQINDTGYYIVEFSHKTDRSKIYRIFCTIDFKDQRKNSVKYEIVNNPLNF